MGDWEEIEFVLSIDEKILEIENELEAGSLLGS